MSNKWRGLERRITLQDAESESEQDRLFGPSYEARQKRLKGLRGGIDKARYTPWRKPRMERNSG